VAQQKLDLIQLASGIMAKPGASSLEMPHAAFPVLYRIQNYAESILKMLFLALTSRLT
jgi:hypothetical protein